MNNFFANKNIIVTGGSSGIGLELAGQLLSNGAHLFLIARNKQKLELAQAHLLQLYPNSKIAFFCCDVSNAHDITKTIAEIGNTAGIDIVVNSAGITACGSFESVSIEDHVRVLETNYLGSYYTSLAALPFLKKSKGNMCFVSSVAGYTGLIGYSAYAPSKFAITALAETLRMELKPYKINVSIIFPPDTETPMLEYERKHTLPESLRLSKNANVIKAATVAKHIQKGIQKGQFEIYCNIESKLIKLLKNLIPSLYYVIVDKIAFSKTH